MASWRRWSWCRCRSGLGEDLAVGFRRRAAAPRRRAAAFVGKGVNGARRWIPLGMMSFQPSELTKLAIALYAAGYMVRRMDVKENFFRAVVPMAISIAIVGLLLLAEPDMGAFLVIATIAMGILFLGGVNGRMFLLISAVLIGAFVLMISLSDWRRERFFAYLNPWTSATRLARPTSSRTR
jgi:cell division protein FtsW